MAYVTDGSCHHGGIAGEMTILQQVLENKSLQDYLGGVHKAGHLGGTGHKADITFQRSDLDGVKPLGISVKTRSSSSGTFDWVNTSSVIKVVPKLASVKSFCDKVSGSYRDTSLSKKEAKPIIDECRAELKSKIISALDSLTPEDVRGILENGLEKYIQEDEFFVSVHYKQESRSEWFEFNSGHPIVELLENPSNSFYLKGKQGSRVIWCKLADGTEYNTMIRLRVVLNNGVGALLAGKKWSSNPTSMVVVKLQQDTPEKLLSQIKDSRSYVL